MRYDILTKTQIERRIKKCAKQGHFQQVAYSIHGNCLTVICFKCKSVGSNYEKRDKK